MIDFVFLLKNFVKTRTKYFITHLSYYLYFYQFISKKFFEMPKKVVKFKKKIGLFWSPLILLLYLLCIATWYINIAAKFDQKSKKKRPILPCNHTFFFFFYWRWIDELLVTDIESNRCVFTSLYINIDR